MWENYLAKLHELVVILYGIAILLYFIDFLQSNRKAYNNAFWLLSIVWILQTIFFIAYMFEIGRFPILTISEGLYFYVWILLTLSLVLNRYLQSDFFIFFPNLLGFIMFVIVTFTPFRWSTEALAEMMASELLIIHIVTSFMAYGAFSISFIFSVLYVIQYQLLKRKKWGKKLKRISNLAKLERMSYILNSVGVPMLIIGVILGLRWAYLKIPDLPIFDWKIVGSMLIIIVYMIYLYMPIRKGLAGKNLALWNISSFLIILINFFLLSTLSSFHFWYY